MRTKPLLLAAAVSALTFAVPGPAALQTPPRVANPVAPAGAYPSFADIIERVSPAVVSIDTRGEAQRRLPTIPGFPFELFPAPPGEAPPTVPSRASGSGFFISADGYIVTNNHVVEGAREITVTLRDQRTLDARVIGRDEATDLAVLKVEGRDLPFVSFANQATPRVGDWVIALGNPFGLGGTATAGIVSAFGRDVGSTFVDYIQIDAPINRGNSGGPTFDAQGRVIGVNTMIFSPSGGSVGIGFAIPADVAQAVTRELIASGRITRGYIGATVQTVTAEMAEGLGLGERRGALIAELTPGAPAERAGLEAGDIVLRVNGRAVRNASQLTREVARARSGDALRLDVLRAGASRTFEVRAGVRPSERDLSGGLEPQRPQGRLGLSVAPLDPAARQRWRIPTEVQGVVVQQVDPDSDAAAKGVRPGDVIVRANDRTIFAPADLAQAIDAASGAGRRTVLLIVNRTGRQQALAVGLRDPARP